MSDMQINENKKKMLQQLRIEQLLDMLHQDAMDEDLSNDGVYAAMIMEVIEEKEIAIGEKHLGDVSQALKDFETKYNTPEGNGQSLFGSDECLSPFETKLLDRPHKKYRKLKHIIAVAAIVTAILSIMIPVAIGSNIFDVVGRWTIEWFHLEQNDSSKQEVQTDTNNLPTTADYETLQDAFDACGIANMNAPQWLPEGYKIIETTAFLQDDYVSISATYKNAEDFLVFSVGSSGSYQKDSADVEEYYFNGVCHYIFSTNANNVIVWNYEGIEYMVSGPVSADLLKQIVKSMYP